MDLCQDNEARRMYEAMMTELEELRKANSLLKSELAKYEIEMKRLKWSLCEQD